MIYIRKEEVGQSTQGGFQFKFFCQIWKAWRGVIQTGGRDSKRFLGSMRGHLVSTASIVNNWFVGFNESRMSYKKYDFVLYSQSSNKKSQQRRVAINVGNSVFIVICMMLMGLHTIN